VRYDPRVPTGGSSEAPLRPRALVTGATGLVGSSVAAELLSRGWQVLALTRAGSHTAARDRVLGVLEGELTEAQAGRLEGLAGEVTRPQLGIDARATGPIEALVHAAADTTFLGTAGGRAVNVEGTAHALDLAVALGAVQVHHVSTTFVAGDADRLRPGDLDLGQAFNNDYERTKFEAEQLVRSRPWPFPVTIHRPAVVVGDSRTGRTPTFRGIYTLLRTACQLVEGRPGDTTGPLLSLATDPQGLRNLIPVDRVAQALVDALETEPGGPIEVLHHVPAEPLTNASLARLLEEVLEVKGLVVGAEVPSSPELQDALAPFQSYLQGEPCFEVSPRGASAGVDRETMSTIIRYARGAGWRGGHRRPRARSQLLRRYHAAILQPRLGRALLENVYSKTAQFQVMLEEDPRERLHLSIVNGILEEVRLTDEVDSPEFLVRVPEPVFRAVVGARQDPRESFFSGDLSVEGDVELALGLAGLMREFFLQTPFPGEARDLRAEGASRDP